MNAQAAPIPVHLDLVVGDGGSMRLASGEVPMRMSLQKDSIVVSVDPEKTVAIVQELCQKVIGTPAAE